MTKKHVDKHAPRPPRLGSVASASRADLIGDLDWLDVSVDEDLSGEDLAGAQVRGSQLTSALLVGSDLRRMRVIDSTFDRCDLAGARADDGSLSRVVFHECRLSGLQLGAARLNDVRFVGCRIDGANFRMVSGERIRFEDCVLTEADFSAAQLTFCSFVRCDLTNTEFSQARIPDASLSGSTVDAIRGVAGLPRPIIDSSQLLPFAMSLMTLHGVVVDDGDSPSD